MRWDIMSEVIQFPKEKEYTVEFILADNVSMKSSEHEIHWKIEYNQGVAKLKARTKEQAKQYITECVKVLDLIE